MKHRRYYIINTGTILITAIFLYFALHSVLQDGDYKTAKVGWIGIAVFIITMVYILKGIRLYLIMLEHRIPLKRFIKTYMKTTLITLILPLKTGEFFKMYCYGNEVQDYKIGFLCVLVDRYFDTIPLMVLLISITLFSGEGITFIVTLLLIFMISIIVVYLVFPSTYRYVNKFCIINIHSHNSIKILKALNDLERWYDYIKNMIRGRGIVLLVLSVISWLMEYSVINCLSIALQKQSSGDMFVAYINSIFIRSDNSYVNIYTVISVFVLMLFAIVVYLKNGARE